MKKDLVYVGVDVDDKAFHFSCVAAGGEVLHKGIRSLPDTGHLLKNLKKLLKRSEFRIAYEATYLGYAPARWLLAKGVECKVIAPTSIKHSPNERVKNDRLDSLRIAQAMQRNDVAYVAIPNENQESDRQMIRTRQFLTAQKSDLKRHVISQCRMLGLDYKSETESKVHWTKKHRQWLDKKIQTLPQSMHIGLSVLLQSLEALERQIDTLDAEIHHLAESNQYKAQAQALACFKGLNTLTAMTLITEIFDIRRFKHPKQLVAFCGLDIREYSSGGKQLQYGISKLGNKRVRTTLVEASQLFWKSSTPSKRKQAARKGAYPKIIKLADRCQERLYKKGHMLLAREKPRNKVKVACAREMIGFIWEALHEVAA